MNTELQYICQALDLVEDKDARLRTVHFRLYDFDSIDSLDVSPRGGLTLVYFVSPTNNSITFATALCSNKDNYNKKLGRNIAIGRLYTRQGITALYKSGEDCLKVIESVLANSDNKDLLPGEVSLKNRLLTKF